MRLESRAFFSLMTAFNGRAILGSFVEKVFKLAAARN
jgi:hypothetical protein